MRSARVTSAVDTKANEGEVPPGKVLVFGILKRGGKVYTQMSPNAQTRTLMPVIEAKVQPASVVYTDRFTSYDVLDVSAFRHYRINHSELFADRQNHINGIENFRN